MRGVGAGGLAISGARVSQRLLAAGWAGLRWIDMARYGKATRRRRIFNGRPVTQQHGEAQRELGEGAAHG